MKTYNEAYQMEVARKLHWLSDYMMSEFDDDSDNSRFKNHVQLFILKVSRNIESRLEESKDAGTFVDPWLWKQKTFAQNLQSDPFVPEMIRTAISKFYLERFDALTNICCEVFEDACDEYYNNLESYKTVNLVQNEVTNPEALGEVIYNRVIEKQSETQYSWEKSLERITEFRAMIENYFIASAVYQ
ncbi:MAG TPA: hypothetical protein VI757_02390 [Bacteroidia bacterium]|nr:hypothetical protein [Bacteroidia bacterium]